MHSSLLLLLPLFHIASTVFYIVEVEDNHIAKANSSKAKAPQANKDKNGKPIAAAGKINVTKDEGHDYAEDDLDLSLSDEDFSSSDELEDHDYDDDDDDYEEESEGSETGSSEFRRKLHDPEYTDAR